MIRRLHGQSGFSLVEVVIAVAAMTILMMVASNKFMSAKSQASVDSAALTVDRQATGLSTWISQQEEFSDRGLRLADLDFSAASPSKPIQIAAQATHESVDNWQLASNVNDAPEDGKSMIWHDVAADGERVRITRCKEKDPATRRVCARMDIFPWGNSQTGDTLINYRFIECHSSGTGCAAPAGNAFWTSAACQEWPKGGTVLKYPNGSGSACTSFVGTDTCPNATSCVTDNHSDYQAPSYGSGPYYLLASATDGGYITSSDAQINCPISMSACSASYSSDSSVTLTAHTNSGYTFMGWGGDAACGNDTTCTVTMSAAKTASAKFVDSTGLDTSIKTPIQISAGSAFTCAVNTSGKAYCWGNNGGGRLGDGTTTQRTSPTAVTSLTSGSQRVSDLSTGLSHACAIISDGTLKCWGYNANGRLGVGSAYAVLNSSATPVSVNLGASAGVTARQLALGASHSCALLTDGTAKCWGYNGYGQLGDGTLVDKTSPTTVAGISNATAIWAGNDYTCAKIGSSSTFKCWGKNNYGQLGNSNNTNTSAPALVSNLSTTAGTSNTGYFAGHNCATNSLGAALCWGYNSSGQLGTNNTTNSNTPANVIGLSSGVNLLTGGVAHSCALLNNGALKCWGSSTYGQLGNGLSSSSSSSPWSYTPVAVGGGLDSGVASVVSGDYHTCATLTNNALRCWGSNSNGQLGNSTTTNSSYPVLVTLP